MTEGVYVEPLGRYLLVERSGNKVVRISFSFHQPTEPSELAKTIADYLLGNAACPKVEMDPAGWTDFQKRIFAVVREIPRGQTMTYGEVAALAGRPGPLGLLEEQWRPTGLQFSFPAIVWSPSMAWVASVEVWISRRGSWLWRERFLKSGLHARAPADKAREAFGPSGSDAWPLRQNPPRSCAPEPPQSAGCLSGTGSHIPQSSLYKSEARPRLRTGLAAPPVKQSAFAPRSGVFPDGDPTISSPGFFRMRGCMAEIYGQLADIHDVV